jgi:multicomponent Na+:H+ antiporter subunit D
MGFALMLAVVPFHAWLPQVAEDGPPLIAAWIVAGIGGAYLILLFDLLLQYEWLAQSAEVQQLLSGGGLLLAIGSSVLIVTERHLGRLWAYAILVDLGYVLLGLGFSSPAGRTAVLLTLVGRMVSLLLSGSALAMIQQRATTLQFDGLVGIGTRTPLSMLAFAIGGLALLGVPLTPGFPGHWAVLRLMADSGNPWTWILALTSVLGLVGFVRAFAVMVAPVEESRQGRIKREPLLATTLLVGLGAVAILIGLAPQTLDPILAFLLGSARF